MQQTDRPLTLAVPDHSSAPTNSSTEDFVMITTDLIRLLDDVELPTPGRWTITGSQPVELCTSRWRRRRRTAIATGELVIDHEPARSTLRLVITPRDPEPADAALTISAVLTRADSSGAWLFHGTAVRGNEAAPVTIDIRYNGVYCQRLHATAWLTVHSTVPSIDGRGRRDVLFGHLNADAPDCVVRPVATVVRGAGGMRSHRSPEPRWAVAR